jgi:hypothetical protein
MIAERIHKTCDAPHRISRGAAGFCYVDGQLGQDRLAWIEPEGFDKAAAASSTQWPDNTAEPLDEMSRVPSLIIPRSLDPTLTPPSGPSEAKL